MSSSTNPARDALIAKRDEESQKVKSANENVERWKKEAHTHSERVSLLNEMIAEMSPPKAAGQSTNGAGKYSNSTIRQGILSVLSEPGAGAMGASKIAKRLLAEGAKSKSPNFKTIVYNECKRIAKQGNVKLEEDGFRITSAGLLASL